MKVLLSIIVLLVAVAEAAARPASVDTLDGGRRRHSELVEMVREFSRIDTNYVEPQKYNFTVMLQNTNTYEVYTLRSRSGNTVRFAPEASIKLGPYIGWRWVFLGYTLDLRHMFSSGDTKKEIDLSLYAAQVGIDLFYRTTGNNYHVLSMDLGKDVNTKPMRRANFDGFDASMKGFNFYYIFNHKRFSYPAAFSQSTVQRRSAGSPLIGIGYMKQKIHVDWDALDRLVETKLGTNVARERLDSTLLFGRVRYKDVNVSGGYAYNWVFARNWLFAVSLSVALSYKRTESEVGRRRLSLRDFQFSNFNADGVGRFGIVYNNMKWYVGMSSIFHTYNYHKKQFSANTSFGNVNLYVGFNFGRKK